MAQHLIVVNRIRCSECDEMVVSRYRWDMVGCKGRHVFADGGRAYLKRSFMDGSDYEEASICTTTWKDLEGNLVEAYQPLDAIISCKDRQGDSMAQPEDWVVYWPEGGARAYTDDEMSVLFDHVPDENQPEDYVAMGPGDPMGSMI